MKVTNHERNIHEVKIEVQSGLQSNMLVVSDVHYDSKHCDRKLLKKHFDLALKSNSPIFCNGDWFDLMGGKYDPRNNLPGTDVLPEYRGSNYIDLVIEDSYEFLKPYGHLLTIWGQGNHETSVTKRMHTNPTKRLVQMLQHDGSPIQMGGYSGYIRWQYRRNKELKAFLMHYHHGYGGNAKRSKGILSADIDSMQHPDADIIVRGHDHNKWHLPLTVERISNQLKRKITKVHHLRTGSYKIFGDGYSGWEVQKGFGQPTIGGWWVDIWTTGGKWHSGVREAD